jgi:DNA-binding NtrC family response regulator
MSEVAQPQPPAPERVLIVEDDPATRSGLAELVQNWGFLTDEAQDGETAMRKITTFRPAIIVSDLVMPRMGGLELLRALQDQLTDLTFILLTAQGTVDSAVEAIKEGAYDYLSKPVDPQRLQILLQKAVERQSTLREVRQLRRQLREQGSFGRIIGNSPGIRTVYRVIEQSAPTSASVLIAGESGTGKELIAQTIHEISPRATFPFVAINCAAIPETLLENELFGHEKGAFTGAGSRKIGRAELAHHGTLFLDEIGDLPLSLQGKILRLVQEKQFDRVGGTQTITVDVRVVAATNRDLTEAVAAKQFRDDLYFRLSVFPVEIPPLRRRRGDIILLAEAFLEKFAREMGRKGLRLGDPARQALLDHNWPGNVRELQNCLERAAILCDGREIRPEHLRLGDSATGGPSLADVLDLSGPLAEVSRRAAARAEEEAIARALLDTGGDRAQAAERLGISLSTLARRVRATPEG